MRPQTKSKYASLSEEKKEERRAYAREYYRRKCSLRESSKDPQTGMGIMTYLPAFLLIQITLACCNLWYVENNVSFLGPITCPTPTGSALGCCNNQTMQTQLMSSVLISEPNLQEDGHDWLHRNDAYVNSSNGVGGISVEGMNMVA